MLFLSLYPPCSRLPLKGIVHPKMEVVSNMYAFLSLLNTWEDTLKYLGNQTFDGKPLMYYRYQNKIYYLVFHRRFFQVFIFGWTVPLRHDTCKERCSLALKRKQCNNAVWQILQESGEISCNLQWTSNRSNVLFFSYQELIMNNMFSCTAFFNR